jgi:hypothetical protein
MSRDPIDLYERLPEIYRVRDAERGRPLRALLDVISEQAEIVRGDIEGLYDDFFIETCSDWVVPYIGDLIGTTPLNDVAQTRRVDVARTIRYRRRKGTLALLEELAGDVTGWGVRAVDLFRLLQWSQNLDHLRRSPSNPPGPESDPRSDRRVTTVNLRNVDALDRIDDPFDEVAHTADVRPVESETGGRRSAGWPALGRVGFFLWRLGSYPMAGVEARKSPECPGAYFFDPLGRDAPLFVNPDPDAEQAMPVFASRSPDVEQSGRATERGVPRRIRDLALALDTGEYAGDDPEKESAGALGSTEAPYHDRLDPDGVCLDGSRSLMIEGVDASEVVVADLEEWGVPPEVWERAEDPGSDAVPRVAVDPELGRIRYRPEHGPRGEGDDNAAPPPRVTHHYGFSADLGGGPYDRRETVVGPGGDGDGVLHVDVAADPAAREDREEEGDAAKVEAGIADALERWSPPSGGTLVVTVHDNSTYRFDDPLEVELDGGGCVVLQAANRRRPHLRLEEPASDPWALRLRGGGGTTAPGGAFVLSGLRIEGGVAVEEAGAIGSVTLLHTTLVPGQSVEPNGSPCWPGRPSLRVSDADGAGPSVRVERSIVGPVELPETLPRVAVRDSVVDHPGPGPAEAIGGGPAGEQGPPARIERSTVLGDCVVRELTLGSESLFVGRVRAERRQTGCLRFSYVGDAVRTPERYRCQPDLARAWQDGDVPAGAAGVPDRFAPPRAMRPLFTSRRYGDPGYARLDRSTPAAIRTGAEDGSEMGAFSHLKQPQREENLRRRLKEYLPVGLDAGLIFVT